MSDNEFIIVDEENKETDSGQTGDDVKQEVVSLKKAKRKIKTMTAMRRSALSVTVRRA